MDEDMDEDTINEDRSERRAPAWLAWLDALPVLWLAVVIFPYALLALHPMVPTRAEVPGVAEAERAALPLLAVLVTAAIIRYFCLRAAASGARPARPPASDGGGQI
jgi:hypothetical protein